MVFVDAHIMLKNKLFKKLNFEFTLTGNILQNRLKKTLFLSDVTDKYFGAIPT